MYKVTFSATVFNPDTEETFNGWVDLVYSRRTLFEAKDVVTRTHDFESVTEAVDFIESQIGSVRDNGDLTFYAEDSDTDDVTGEDWSYAAHIEVQR